MTGNSNLLCYYYHHDLRSKAIQPVGSRTAEQGRASDSQARALLNYTSCCDVSSRWERKGAMRTEKENTLSLRGFQQTSGQR